MDMVFIKDKILTKLNKLKTNEDYAVANEVYENEGLSDWLYFLQEKGVFPNDKIFIWIKYHCSIYPIDDENYSEPDMDYIDRVMDAIKPIAK